MFWFMKVLSQVISDNYAIYHGDSCEVLKVIPDNSIHFTVYSPPFESLYTYSNSERDLGNSKNSEFRNYISNNKNLWIN